MLDRGRKGYIVNDAMRGFRDFLKVMGPKPVPSATVDRIDPTDREYAPDKVRWADKGTQARNRACVHTIRCPDTGEYLDSGHLAKRHGVSPSTVRSWHKRGWTDSQILAGARGRRRGTAPPDLWNLDSRPSLPPRRNATPHRLGPHGDRWRVELPLLPPGLPEIGRSWIVPERADEADGLVPLPSVDSIRFYLLFSRLRDHRQKMGRPWFPGIHAVRYPTGEGAPEWADDAVPDPRHPPDGWDGSGMDGTRRTWLVELCDEWGFRFLTEEFPAMWKLLEPCTPLRELKPHELDLVAYHMAGDPAYDASSDEPPASPVVRPLFQRLKREFEHYTSAIGKRNPGIDPVRFLGRG